VAHEELATNARINTPYTAFANDSLEIFPDPCIPSPPYDTRLYVASGHGFDTLEFARSGADYN